MDERPTLRGIFAFEDEETPEWRRVVLTDGTGGVPKFATKSECEEFVRRNCWRGSNPDHPHLQHVLSTLVDWRQIETVLLPKMNEYDERYPPQAPSAEMDAQNRFLYDAGAATFAGIESRLNLPFHQQTNRESTINTLKYMFNHVRSGVFVMIRRRRVVLFVPFANKDFANNWGDQLQFSSSDGLPHQYFREKQRQHGSQQHEADPRRWWTNGNEICTEDARATTRQRDGPSQPSHQYVDDRDLLQLRDLLEDACQHRNVPDCEFFINKQKYPVLKDNASEPFGFLFDKDDLDENQDIPLKAHSYSAYAPVMSLHASKRYADLPFPTSVAWEVATGLQFPQSFMHSHCTQCPCGDSITCENLWECFCDGDVKPHGIVPARDLFTAANLRKFSRDWTEKTETAFFRGSFLGSGSDVASNQRVKLAQLADEWRAHSPFNGSRSNGAPFLDAALTKVDGADVKITAKPVAYLEPSKLSKLDAGVHQFVPIYEQAQYKYIVYVDGLCASKRYPYLMRTGSVILKVESTCVAKEAWFSSLLKPFEDHVPIKADLSDLAEKIQWCRDNDDECRAIAQRAADVYERYLSKDAIHDYVEMVCHRIAERFRPAPSWYHRPTGVDSIQKPLMSRPRSLCVTGANSRHCRRCRELKKEEDDAREQGRQRGRDGDRRGDYDHHRGERSSYRDFRESSYDDRHGGGGGRDRSFGGGGGRSYNDRDDYSRDNYAASRDGREAGSPKRQKVSAEPQCRRCRRIKNACTCNYKR